MAVCPVSRVRSAASGTLTGSMDGRAASGLLLPPASGVVEATCVFKLEGMPEFDPVGTTIGGVHFAIFVGGCDPDIGGLHFGVPKFPVLVVGEVVGEFG
jgi:hypothetical protein